MSGLTARQILGVEFLGQRICIFIAFSKVALLNLTQARRKKISNTLFLPYVPNIILRQSDPLPLLHEHSLWTWDGCSCRVALPWMNELDEMLEMMQQWGLEAQRGKVVSAGLHSAAGAGTRASWVPVQDSRLCAAVFSPVQCSSGNLLSKTPP